MSKRKLMPSVETPEKVGPEVQRRQNNILWPDTLRNAAEVDRFMLKGSRDATFGQRVGMLLVGVMIVGIAIVIFASVSWHSEIQIAVGICGAAPFCYLGLRVIRNAFRY